jgi:hypothetical protein
MYQWIESIAKRLFKLCKIDFNQINITMNWHIGKLVVFNYGNIDVNCSHGVVLRNKVRFNRKMTVRMLFTDDGFERSQIWDNHRQWCTNLLQISFLKNKISSKCASITVTNTSFFHSRHRSSKCFTISMKNYDKILILFQI